MLKKRRVVSSYENTIKKHEGHDLGLSSRLPIFPTLNAPLRIRISYVRHDASLLRARALRHNRISKTRCAPPCRPLRLTWALFTPGQTGNSISTNYHSFRKKDKCKREPNRCRRHYLKLHTFRDVTFRKRKIYKRVYALSCSFDLPWRGRFFFIDHRFIVGELVRKERLS